MHVSKKGFAKDIIIVGLLLIGVFFVVRYSDPIRNSITGVLGSSFGSVKGTSTARGQEVTASLKKDLSTQIENAKKAGMHVSVGDVVNGVSRTEKIMRDLGKLKMYISDQIHRILSQK